MANNILDCTLEIIHDHGGYANWCLPFVLVIVVVICICSCNGNNEEAEMGTGEAQMYHTRRGSSAIRFEQEQGIEHLDKERTKQGGQNKNKSNEDHGSTFLFDKEQYSKHSDVTKIEFRQTRGEHRSLTIFKEIDQFERLERVTISGIKLEEVSLLNLSRCKSLQYLTLSNCQIESIPRSLVDLKELKTLDLSSNKIEEIPYEILKMEKMNKFFCNNNKVARWLEPSNGERHTTSPLAVLNLSNNSLEEVPRCIKDLKKILDVDLSYNKLGANEQMLNEQLAELFYLPSVSKIRLGNNNIKTLPQLDMTKVSTKITKIDLCNNEIVEVPAALFLMPNLTELYLSSNKIITLPTDLDPNQVSPNLYDIDMSDNELNEIPLVLCLLPLLETLILKKNKISMIPENVKSCKNLRFLNISFNMLKEIPSHVFGLPKLQMIDASNNHINSVSALQKEESSEVEAELDLFLTDNCFSQFPEALIHINTHKLKRVDLRSNKIKQIPKSIMDMPKDVKIKLQDNPIVEPPLKVCQRGLKAIQAFYEDLTEESSITKCLKTMFLGTYEAGKTSLVSVLQSNRSKLTKPEERTHGIEIAEIDFPIPNTHDTITLSVWDFAGQDTYYITHQFFLSAKALTLLVVNLEKYDSSLKSFNSTCGKWVKTMIAKVGNPVVIPVATHIDKLKTEEVDRRCGDLAQKLEDLVRMHKRDLETQQGQKESNRVEYKPVIRFNPLPVSSANLKGIEKLKEVILDYAGKKELFPDVGRHVPKAWADIEACVEKRGNELSIPFVTWDEFTSLLEEHFPEHRFKTVAQYLHDTGKILWYSEIKSLQNHVILKPAYLVNIFRKVVRHDREEFLDYRKNLRYKEAMITEADFHKMKKDLDNNGILNIKLLRCLWSDVEKIDGIFDGLIDLMRQFDLCYDLEIGENDGQTRDNQLHPVSRLLLPWSITEGKEDEAESQWQSGGMPLISIQYQFPSFMPPGLFDRLTVRAHHPKHNLHFVWHRKKGILCKHKDHKILVLLKNEGEESLVVSLSARPESKSTDDWQHVDPVTVMWKTLKKLTAEMKKLLEQWPGAAVGRSVICPLCRKPSFCGEWLEQRSKELVICELCDERVPLNHVSPMATLTRRSRRSRSSSTMVKGSTSQSSKLQLSDQQLLSVAQNMGIEWESVAIYIGISKLKLDEIKSNNPYNAEQQKFTMLTTWRDQQGSKATKGELQGALEKAKVSDVLSCLDESDVSSSSDQDVFSDDEGDSSDTKPLR